MLHLLAVANEAGVALSIDDFDEISARTPLIADLKPGGRFVALDMYRAGGMRLVVKRLLDAGLIHGDAPTVTGNDGSANIAAEGPGNSLNHGGGGQNVLYIGGNVRYVTTRTVGIGGDDIYVNLHQRVLAGVTPSDTVLGASDASP